MPRLVPYDSTATNWHCDGSVPESRKIMGQPGDSASVGCRE